MPPSRTRSPTSLRKPSWGLFSLAPAAWRSHEEHILDMVPYLGVNRDAESMTERERLVGKTCVLWLILGPENTG